MSWKLRGRLAGFLILALSFVSANASLGVPSATANAGDPVLRLDAADPAMTRAAAEAQRHLDGFLSRVIGNGGNALEVAGVKIALPLPGGGEEHVWVTPYAGSGDRHLGILDRAPKAIAGHRRGDAITFTRSQVRDWVLFGADGRMYGGFVARAMLARMDARTARGVGAALSEAPLPPGW